MGSVFGQTGTVGAAALLVACGGGAPQVESGQVTAAVIDGTPSPAEHDAVLLLHVEGQNGIFNDCTATLISPRIVVTAKHCVSLVQPGDFVCRGNGELVQDGTGAGIFGQVVDPASIAFYVGTTPSSAPASHGMQVVATGSPDACHDDIAMVVLDQPIAVTRLVALELRYLARCCSNSEEPVGNQTDSPCELATAEPCLSFEMTAALRAFSAGAHTSLPTMLSASCVR